MFYILAIAVLAIASAEPPPAQSQHPSAEARQFNYGAQYPFDLQYDFTLLDPQLQYPPFSGENARLQPQVLLYPGGAPGQPFLLQPGAPPGNFLIPQPHPGVILRDAPQRPPPVFISGYPKPAHIPPINKDAEEIPPGSGSIQPVRPTGRKPEKLETFDLPEFGEPSENPSAGEPDILPSSDKNLARNPPLKPGHRFFILNGQPLFSNYPLPQFGGSPFQSGAERFANTNPDYFLYRQNGPAFLPDGFNKQLNDVPPYKVPVNNLFLRNSVTGQISSAKPNFDSPKNDDVDQYQQNLISLNHPEDYRQNVLLRNSVPIPLQKHNPEGFQFFIKELSSKQNSDKLEPRDRVSSLKLRPIEVPDEDPIPLYEGNIKPGIAQTDYFRYRPEKPSEDDKDSVVIDAKYDDNNNKEELESEVISALEKSKEPSTSQAQPGAIALAGPGGVASAAPRGTALTGDKGLAVSSPQATAIAGPSKEQIEQKTEKTKNGKQ